MPSRLISNTSFTSMVHNSSSRNYCHGRGVIFALRYLSITIFVASTKVAAIPVYKYLKLANRTRYSKNSHLIRPVFALMPDWLVKHWTNKRSQLAMLSLSSMSLAFSQKEASSILLTNGYTELYYSSR